MKYSVLLADERLEGSHFETRTISLHTSYRRISTLSSWKPPQKPEKLKWMTSITHWGMNLTFDLPSHALLSVETLLPPRFCPHSVKEFISTEGSSKFCYLTFVCLRDLYQLSVFKNSSCRAGERRTTSSFEAVASMGSGSNLVCVCRLPSGPQKNYPRFDTRPLGGVGAW
jgi:hypothetical protein